MQIDAAIASNSNTALTAILTPETCQSTTKIANPQLVKNNKKPTAIRI